MKATVWFEAQGRSAYSRGLPLNYGRALRVNLPTWARSAWARGWLSQGAKAHMAQTIVTSFEKQAAVRSMSLKECVTQFLQEHSA